MQLIDFHTHFFPNKLYDAIWKWFENYAWPIQYKKYSEELIEILKAQGVTRAVSLHYPHKAGMAASLNEWAFRLGQAHPDFIIPFGSVHPDDENRESLLRTCFEDYGFKGIKIHCHVQKVSADDPRMEKIYQVCAEHKKIVLIHCGTGPHFKEKPVIGYGYDVTTVSGVKSFENVIRKYPDIEFVVPHLGYEEVDEFFQLLPDYPNLYLDTTMALANYFPVEVSSLDLQTHADRLIFGTDFPNIPYEWSREREAILTRNLGHSIERKIFYSNAARLLGMD